MGLLKNVKTVAEKKPDIIFLYGVEGIGKTTFAASAPKPIFVCTEDPGFDKLGINVPHVFANDWSDITSTMVDLCDKGHGYKTLVIDTMDWAANMCRDYIVDKKFDGEEEKFKAYGRGNESLQNEYKRIMDGAKVLKNNYGMGIVLLAHARIVPYNNPIGENYDRFQAKLPDSKTTSLNKIVTELSDIVLFANYDTGGTITETGKPVMFTTHTQAWDAKNRHRLPVKLPLSYTALQEQIEANKPSTLKQEDKSGISKKTV